MQSLKAQVANLLVGKAGGGKQKQKKKKMTTTKANWGDASKEGSKQKAAKNSKGIGKGKAGVNPSANEQVGDKNKGTTAASKGKRVHPSKSRSGGKKAAGNKKKRN